MIVTFSPRILVFAQQQIPFNGLTLAYFSETTQSLQEKTGINATAWTTLAFHNVSSTSSKMDINVNGTITENNQQRAEKVNMIVNFPTNQNTLLYLRDGGQDNLSIYAGPSGLTLPSLPGLTIDLTRSWNLHDKPLIRTPIGAFSSYRYHTGIKSIPLPNGQTVDLDFYASYDMNTQVLIAGEVWATLNGSSAMIEQTEIRAANLLSSNGQSQCLIATATFGSATAPAVQFLRDFRDHQILSTASGTAFMQVFNAWYYSFSPSVAGYISTHVTERTIMKGVLIPLIGILGFSSLAFNATSAFPELAVLVSGLVASSLIGAFYLGLPLSLLRAKVRRLRRSKGQTLERTLLTILLGGVAVLFVGELLASPVLLMMASATIVLSTLFLSAAYTSRRIAGKLQPQ
jgi:peptide/nickel transport system substrate-binding protein